MADGRDLEQMVREMETNDDYNGYLKRIAGMLGTASIGDLLNNMYARLRLNGRDNLTSITVDICVNYIQILLPQIASFEIVKVGSLTVEDSFIDGVRQFFYKKSGEYVSLGTLKVLKDFFEQIGVSFDFQEF